MGKKPIVSVTYENERISIKKQLNLLKMCGTSLLCGPQADLWPFYGFLCKRGGRQSLALVVFLLCQREQETQVVSLSVNGNADLILSLSQWLQSGRFAEIGDL